MFRSKPPSNVFITPSQAEPRASGDDVETVVGPSVNVEGDFSSQGNIVIKGMVSGSVKTSKLLSVEKGARILANVKAGSAVVSGVIKGNIKVNDRLELSETAQIAGDMECKVLTVAPGALLQGKITMKGIEMEEVKDDKKMWVGKAKAEMPAEGGKI